MKKIIFLTACLIMCCECLAAALISPAYSQTHILIDKYNGGSPTPLTLYGDWSENACLPTIILSHGLGGSEDAFPKYATAFVQHGYRVAVMGHGEKGKGYVVKLIFSDDHKAILEDPKKWKRRFRDLNATYNFVTHHCDPKPLIMAGHSMGAATTFLEAGAKGVVQYGGKDRFDAYITLSPQGTDWMFSEGSWQDIKKPILMVTGTKDNSKRKDYTMRFAAFNGLPPGHKRFVIINNANHIDIGGHGKDEFTMLISNIMIEFVNSFSTSPLPQSLYSNNATIMDK